MNEHYAYIYGNPDDLEIFIWQYENESWFAKIKHHCNTNKNFIPIVLNDGEELDVTYQQILQRLRDTLVEAQRVGEQVLFGPDKRKEGDITEFGIGYIQNFFNPDNLSKEQYLIHNLVLEDNDIEKIFLCIERNLSARTYNWQNYWEKRQTGWKFNHLPGHIKSQKIEMRFKRNFPHARFHNGDRY